MEFRTILSLLIKSFDENNIRYGLIGGFALIMLGVPRTTVDLDFLVHRDDLEKLNRIMKKIGYKLVFQSENVSQYVSDLSSFGEVDFLHAFRDYSIKMLKQSQPMKFNDLSIMVLKPEDVIGLKVQAMVNDVTRKNKELADIESILEKHQEHVNWRNVKEYFMLFELDEEYKTLENRYGNAN